MKRLSEPRKASATFASSSVTWKASPQRSRKGSTGSIGSDSAKLSAPWSNASMWTTAKSKSSSAFRRQTRRSAPGHPPEIDRVGNNVQLSHNKTYPTYREFAEATLTFLREKVPKNWLEFCDSVSDNFRLINPKDFRVLA
jgi:hypothetical protein